MRVEMRIVIEAVAVCWCFSMAVDTKCSAARCATVLRLCETVELRAVGNFSERFYAVIHQNIVHPQPVLSLVSKGGNRFRLLSGYLGSRTGRVKRARVPSTNRLHQAGTQPGR
jgi:hypothetical protein